MGSGVRQGPAVAEEGAFWTLYSKFYCEPKLLFKKRNTELNFCEHFFQHTCFQHLHLTSPNRSQHRSLAIDTSDLFGERHKAHLPSTIVLDFLTAVRKEKFSPLLVSVVGPKVEKAD